MDVLAVEPGDLRGTFHNHSTYSDGASSIEEMALAAKALGFEYFGVGDHSQSLTVARGMPPGIVRKQWAENERLAEEPDRRHPVLGERLGADALLHRYSELDAVSRRLLAAHP